MKAITVTAREAEEIYGKDLADKIMAGHYRVTLSPAQQIALLKTKGLKQGTIFPYNVAYVYLVHDGQHRCKVGRTDFPKSRLAALSTGSPLPLAMSGALAFSYDDAKAFEKAMHRRLTAMGLHIHNEWFSANPEDVFSEMQSVCEARYEEKRLSFAEIFEYYEPLMPLFRLYRRDNAYAIERGEKARNEFLWLMEQMG